jgi:hypothetical protein
LENSPVLWSSGTIREAMASNSATTNSVTKTTLPTAHLAGLPTVSSEDLAAAPSDAGPQLRRLLRRYGMVFVSGLDVTNPHHTTEDIVRRFVGYPRETFWGTLWDTAGEALAVFDEGHPPDTAYTSLPLNPHTDCSYLRDPPQLQVCLQSLLCFTLTHRCLP